MTDQTPPSSRVDAGPVDAVPVEAGPLPQVAEWTYATRRLALVMLIILAVGLAWLSLPVLPVLLIAGILAFLVRPAILRLERRGIRHAPAVLIVYAAVAVVGLVILLAIMPRLVHEVERAVSTVSQFVRRGPNELAAFVEQYRTLSLGEFRINLSPLVDRLLGILRQTEVPSDLSALESLVGPVQQLLSAASSLFLGALGLLIRGVLALAISLYMALEAPLILREIEGFMGKDQSAENSELMRRVIQSWSDFLRGQVVLMLVIGVVVTIGALILGLPGALALGLLAGVLEMLPNIGPIIATIPAVIVALVAGSETLPVSNGVFALIILGFYALVQQLENSLIVPRVIGKAVALPSVLIMIAVIVGAEVGGVMGAFVAAPCLATLREVAAYTLDKIRGVDPYPQLRSASAVGPGDDAAALAE